MEKTLFNLIDWVDPIDKTPLRMEVLLEDQYGKPLYGALVKQNGKEAYPIIDGVVLATSEFAAEQRGWLKKMGYEVPYEKNADPFQTSETVGSFGFQWNWDAEPRTEEDLTWRVAERYDLNKDFYKDKIILDAGCGAGDQTKWMHKCQAKAVVSIDLSDAIFVTEKKMRENTNFVAIRGDLTNLPISENFFDFVYCEGVIQHTQNSKNTVLELTRVLKMDGDICATHYGYLPPIMSGFKPFFRRVIDTIFFYKRRERLSKWNQDKLFLYCGVLAWMAHLPILGYFVRKSRLAIHNPRMMNFKATWCNTYDCYGTHTYQREISSDEFRSLFDFKEGYKMNLLFEKESALHLKKTGI